MPAFDPFWRTIIYTPDAPVLVLRSSPRAAAKARDPAYPACGRSRCGGCRPESSRRDWAPLRGEATNLGGPFPWPNGTRPCQCPMHHPDRPSHPASPFAVRSVSSVPSVVESSATAPTAALNHGSHGDHGWAGVARGSTSPGDGAASCMRPPSTYRPCVPSHSAMRASRAIRGTVSGDRANGGPGLRASRKARDGNAAGGASRG